VSSITYYCPNCWRELSANVRVCPNCHTRLDKRAEDSFVDKLIGALNHPVPAKAAFAARVLGERRETRAVEFLLRTLETDREPELQEAAIRALGEIGDARSVPVIAGILNDSHRYLSLRVAAAGALAKIGTPEAIVALQTAQRAGSRAVARAAREAFESLGTFGMTEHG
jgi:HEAT repeat protein